MHARSRRLRAQRPEPARRRSAGGAVSRISGLNLTFEVREGLQKHRQGNVAPRWRRRSPIWPMKSPTTATISTTRSTLRSYSPEQLAGGRRSGARAMPSCSGAIPDVHEPELHKLIIRDIIDVQVRDAVTSSAEAIERAGVQQRGGGAGAGGAIDSVQRGVGGRESRTAPLPLSECLLPSAGGEGESAGV